MRCNRALAESRDLTERERQLSVDDRDELEALQKAVTIAEHRERVMQAISEVTEQRSAPFQPTLSVSAISSSTPQRCGMGDHSAPSRSRPARG